MAKTYQEIDTSIGDFPLFLSSAPISLYLLSKVINMRKTQVLKHMVVPLFFLLLMNVIFNRILASHSGFANDSTVLIVYSDIYNTVTSVYCVIRS